MALVDELRAAFQEYTDAIGIADIIDDEGAAYAENLGINLTQTVRQQRNELEAGVDGRMTEEDLVDATDLTPTPRQEQNLEASSTTHLKAMFRRIADAIGKDLKARKFMGIGDDDADPLVLKLNEYADGNHPNLGEHPFSSKVAVPIPPSHEDVAKQAAELLPKLSPLALGDRERAWQAFLNSAVKR